MPVIPPILQQLELLNYEYALAALEIMFITNHPHAWELGYAIKEYWKNVNPIVTF